MDDATLEARFDELEAKNRSLKALAVVALFAAFLVPAGTVIGALAYVQSKTTTLSVELAEVRAKRFVVVNERRRSRGTLSARRDGAELTLGAAGGGRVALRARAEGSQVSLRDPAHHEAELSVASSGAATWRAAVRLAGREIESGLDANDTTAGLAVVHRDAQQHPDARAHVMVGGDIGATLDFSTHVGEQRVRHAELSVPPPEARTGTALRLEQRGSSLTARIGGTPRIDLRRGATAVWSTPAGAEEGPNPDEHAE